MHYEEGNVKRAKDFSPDLSCRYHVRLFNATYIPFISPKTTKKGSISASLKGNRQRPILPGRVQPSTFGTGELNYCVRYGNRWDLSVITTGKISGRVSFFSFCSASFLLSFRSARSPLRFRSFPNPQPAVTCFSSLGLLLFRSLLLRFLPFRALRFLSGPFSSAPCSVPGLSASFPFRFLPFQALCFPSPLLPCLSLRFRSVLQAVSSFALFSAP